MRRFLPVGLAIGFVALLGYGLVANAAEDSIDQSLADGMPADAPSFELPVLEDGELPPQLARRIGPALEDGNLGLDELRGSVVVLNFWASWCVPCREEAPLLTRSWERAGPSGVVFLGLNMQDLTDDAGAFIDEFEITYPNVRDQTDAVATDWGVVGLPETYFIAADGRVVNHVIGVVSKPQLRAGIAAARSGRPIAPTAGGPQRSTR